MGCYWGANWGLINLAWVNWVRMCDVVSHLMTSGCVPVHPGDVSCTGGNNNSTQK